MPSRTPLPNQGRFAMDSVARVLLQGFPVEIRGQDFIMVDKIYQRMKVEGSDEVRPVGDIPMEFVLHEAERHLSTEEVFLLGAEKVLAEERKYRNDAQPIDMIRTRRLLQDSLAKHKDKVLRIEKFDYNGETVVLDRPVEAVVTRDPGRLMMLYACQALYTPGASVRQVDSHWRIAFLDAQMHRDYPDATVAGLTVLPQQGEIVAPDAQPLRERTPEVKTEELSP